jgi:hypothetical protein
MLSTTPRKLEGPGIRRRSKIVTCTTFQERLGLIHKIADIPLNKVSTNASVAHSVRVDCFMGTMGARIIQCPEAWRKAVQNTAPGKAEQKPPKVSVLPTISVILT